MQTYSHLLITAVASRHLQKRRVNVSTKALLLGSMLPDLPLFALTIGYAGYRRWVNPALMDEFIFGPTYDALYFTNPWWLAGHNLFHAPPMILFYMLVGWLALRRGAGWGRWLFWLGVGCAGHSFIDILTHVHDGPLLFFPFNWTLRFAAPVSYWDPAYGGGWFAIFEHGLDLALIGWLLRGWWRGRTTSGGVKSRPTEAAD